MLFTNSMHFTISEFTLWTSEELSPTFEELSTTYREPSPTYG